MSVTKDEISAYLSGRLEGEEAARIEAEMAADPDLASRFAPRHRDPAMADLHTGNVNTSGQPKAPAQILDFAAARSRRDKESRAKAKATKPRRQPVFSRPGLAAALVGTLVLGVVGGLELRGPAQVSIEDGQLTAGTILTQALETTLSGAPRAPSNTGPFQVLASFQQDNGNFCRLFTGQKMAGIACKNDGKWVLKQTMAVKKPISADMPDNTPEGEALETAAHTMALGDALGPAQEKAARKAGWQN